MLTPIIHDKQWIINQHGCFTWKISGFRCEERKIGAEMVSYSVFSSIRGTRTRWTKCGKCYDSGRKLTFLCVFSPAIDSFSRKSCIFAAKTGIYAKLNYWSQRRNRSAGEVYTPIRDKIAISCMWRQIHEFSSHAIRHELYIKNRKRLFCP